MAPLLRLLIILGVILAEPLALQAAAAWPASPEGSCCSASTDAATAGAPEGCAACDDVGDGGAGCGSPCCCCAPALALVAVPDLDLQFSVSHSMPPPIRALVGLRLVPALRPPIANR